MKTHVSVCIALVILLGTTFAAGSPEGSGQFSFTLNGESISPSCRTLKSLGINRDKVIVSLGKLVLLLDRKPTYALTGDYWNDGKLYLEASGKKRLIGLVAHEVYKDGGNRVVDPFVDLQAEDMKHVRGVYLNLAPSKHTLDLLGQVDPKKVFFRITEKTGAGTPMQLPALPPGVMFLDIDERSSEGIKDYSGLKLLKSLVYLRINSGNYRDALIDIEAIARNKNLVALDLAGQKFKTPANFNQLSELHYLDLSWCSEVTDSSFLGNLTELRELRIENSGIEDLTPLEDLKKITTVNASGSPVKSLPKKRVASLRQLNLIATQLTEEQVAAFRESNPGCKVQHSWTSTLRTALEGADRIRVRSGGTCHRDPGKEKTLFEITDDRVVRDTIARIVLQPSDGGIHCMCCGSPSFEFYMKGKLVVTLGFHHGRSLRWMGGDWPGDALLSPESGDFLCEWLAGNGIDRPLKERNEEKQREKASEARMVGYRDILPDDIERRLSEAASAEDTVNAFMDGEKDKIKRVTLALKMIGSHNGSWNRRNILDPVAIALLNNGVPTGSPDGWVAAADLKKEDIITVSDIVDAFTANRSDPMVVRGTARWFFGEKNYGTIPEKSTGELLSPIVEAGMTHPRLENRRRTLYALADIKSAPAIEELRKVLAGKFTIESLKPEEQMEPGGIVEFTRQGDDIGEECSDQALAALLLAKLQDKKSLPEIRMLLEAENDLESRKALQKAVMILETSP